MDAGSRISSTKPKFRRQLDYCEGVVGGDKQQKENGAAKLRHGRVLFNIGNLVTVGGIQVNPNCPSTSFYAQFLTNAQNNKMQKQACTNLVGAPPVKPKPDEEVKQDKCGNKKKEEGNSRKKSHTLTSVLTARSKEACGLANKLKEQTVDIDAADTGNELAAVEYIEDIYKFYKLVENESRPHDYMNSQPEFDESMRAILVNWLIAVHNKFDLSLETLYLTINIIDRFLAVKTVSRRELQLVGVSAMLMASKYEKIWATQVNEFVHITDRAYTREQILVMEKTILSKLEWTLTVPTPYVFLVRFIKASIPDQKLENMVHFLSELGMTQYATTKYCPSMLAASAVLAARFTLNKSPAWNDTLKLHTGYSEEQLMDCARLLVSFHSMAGNGKFPVVYIKYLELKRGAVALMPPATNLLPGCAARV